MINASQAREWVEESEPIRALKVRIDAKLVEINKKIFEVCKEGQSEIEIDYETDLKIRLLKTLQEKGFIAGVSGHQTMRISW